MGYGEGASLRGIVPTLKDQMTPSKTWVNQLNPARGTYGKGLGINSKTGFEPRPQSAMQGIAQSIAPAGTRSGALQDGGQQASMALQDATNRQGSDPAQYHDGRDLNVDMHWSYSDREPKYMQIEPQQGAAGMYSGTDMVRPIQPSGGSFSSDYEENYNSSSFGPAGLGVQDKGLGRWTGSNKRDSQFTGAGHGGRRQEHWQGPPQPWHNLRPKPDPVSKPPTRNQPDWITNDKKVLTFAMYTKEILENTPGQVYRVRYYHLNYFLEDGSIRIIEQSTEESGAQSSTFLRRHRALKEDGPKTGGPDYYTYYDLNVGIDLCFYGRIFHVYDCDEYTRNWYAQARIDLNPPEMAPEDPTPKPYANPAVIGKSVARKRSDLAPTTLKNAFEKTRPDSASLAGSVQFLKNDRKVLHFKASWQDRTYMGDTREFYLNYFLADDTAEVLEIQKENSGRDPFPALLKRCKMPKQVSGSMLAPSQATKQYYGPEDLVCGTTISVYGRKLFLYDCDTFTIQWYASELGIEQVPVTPKHLQPSQPVQHPIPAHNGFGSEEDTIQNVLKLVPRRPKHGLDPTQQGKKISFLARMDAPPSSADTDRRFVLNFALDSKEITVFEQTKANDGRQGGKFLERTKVKNPQTGDYYKQSDLYIGKQVVIFNHHFILTDLDGFSMSYMQEHPDLFPYADVERIKTKLASKYPASNVEQLHQRFQASDKDGSGTLDRAEFIQCLQLEDLNEQEIATLLREFDRNGDGHISYKELSAAVTQKFSQNEAQHAEQSGVPPAVEYGSSAAEVLHRMRQALGKRGGVGTVELDRAFKTMDPMRRGVISQQDFVRTLTFTGFRLSSQEIDILCNQFQSSAGQISYPQLIGALEQPAPSRLKDMCAGAWATFTKESGMVHIDEITSNFDARSHPHVQRRERTLNQA
jgi:Ca2+-binding EF-hand superfamily protein